MSSKKQIVKSVVVPAAPVVEAVVDAPVVEAAIEQFNQVAKRAIDPTMTTIHCILGRVSCAELSVTITNKGLPNSTRWVLDVEHTGSEAVELPLQLLSNAGRLVTPDVVSFSFGAINSNFYVARPYIIQRLDTLLLKTSTLKERAVVKYRLSLDIIHSSNR